MLAVSVQALDHDEQINVRWAYDDPNPRAQAVRLRNDAQTMLAAMEARGDLEAPLEYPEELPPAKRQQLGGEESAEAAASYDTGAVPMTREEHEAETLRQAMREEQHAAQLAALEAEQQREAEHAEVATNASRLDAILQVRVRQPVARLGSAPRPARG